ncbi:hypothetical protein [Rhizobium lusitanum]|nr:hypothetical protein [Rhizobium lusitanum]MBM7048403.1 hypothetical protein [Rhizobium lusitanum]
MKNIKRVEDQIEAWTPQQRLVGEEVFDLVEKKLRDILNKTYSATVHR